ncbi:hypothetical protein LPJ71_001539, partial [Coemansia sp. S17]
TRLAISRTTTCRHMSTPSRKPCLPTLRLKPVQPLHLPTSPVRRHTISSRYQSQSEPGA